MKNNVGRMFMSSRIGSALSILDPVAEALPPAESLPDLSQWEGDLWEGALEDGLSFSRRSVLTEKLLPATLAPLPRRRVQPDVEPLELHASLHL